MQLDIEYVLAGEPEDCDPADHFDDSDEGDADVTWVHEQLSAGNQWAWFRAVVTARVTLDGQTFEGVDSLGCCSYKSEDDFRQCQYFDDMKTEARYALLASLHTAVRRGELAAVALTQVTP